MANDRFKGRGKQIIGGVQERVGRTDAERTEGSIKKTEGKIQEGFGKAKGKVRKGLS